MIVHRFNRLVLLPLLAFLLAGPAFGHGGVVEEDDICVIKVNFLRAHFKIYQTRESGHEQFCEDLPAASESIFVMEYLHESLAEMPIDFRIIHDVTGKGRFARLEDVEAIESLDDVTVFYRPPTIEPAVYAVMHEFDTDGQFIGIVSATHPETGKVYTAVFPFEVGYIDYGYWPWIVGLLVLIQLNYLLMSGRLRRWFSKAAPAALLLLVMTPDASAADLVVSYTPEDGEIELNRMHSWVLHIETDGGAPVEGAIIEVDGGMPKHDHGLPTRPRVTEDLGGGDYRLEGLRFHMRGAWEIVLTISTDDGVSTVIIPFKL